VDLTRFRQSLERENLTPKTIQAYTSDLKRISGFVPDLETATLADLQGAFTSLAEEGVAAGSRNRMLAALRKFYGSLTATGQREDDPTVGLERAKTVKQLPVVLTGEEIDKLRIAAAAGTKFYRKRDTAIIALLAGSGLRRNELASLEVSDIDLERGCVFVRFGKGRKQRVVPIWGAMLEAVREHVEDLPEGSPLWPSQHGGRLTPGGIWRLIKRLAKKAGLDHRVAPHSLRHSCATAMHAGGKDLDTIKKMMGHSNIATTSGYIHQSVETMRCDELYRPKEELDAS
jgi:site-specific recombinase XerD